MRRTWTWTWRRTGYAQIARQSRQVATSGRNPAGGVDLVDVKLEDAQKGTPVARRQQSLREASATRGSRLVAGASSVQTSRARSLCGFRGAPSWSCLRCSRTAPRESGGALRSGRRTDRVRFEAPPDAESGVPRCAWERRTVACVAADTIVDRVGSALPPASCVCGTLWDASDRARVPTQLWPPRRLCARQR